MNHDEMLGNLASATGGVSYLLSFKDYWFETKFHLV